MSSQDPATGEELVGMPPGITLWFNQLDPVDIQKLLSLLDATFGVTLVEN